MGIFSRRDKYGFDKNGMHKATGTKFNKDGFEGIGLGNGSAFKYATLWVTFLILAICIVNILIAVVSDGYEIHKDNQRLRTKSGETIIQYGWHRFLYHTRYHFIPWLKKHIFRMVQSSKEPLWARKMRFTSSEDARILLEHCDLRPEDYLIFDKALQYRVYQELVRTKDEEKIQEVSGLERQNVLVRSIDEDDPYFEKKVRLFFSTIESVEMLTKIIKIIFSEDKSKAHVLKDSWSKPIGQNGENVYEKIWNLYKHNKEEKEEKEAKKVAGNHVRKVVQHLEDKITRLEERQEELQAATNTKLDEMNAKMAQLLKILQES